MWIGKPKPGAEEVPAWSFMIEDREMVPRLKGILTKVIYETNMQEDIERAQERDDHDYLENQVLGDIAEDADMDGIEKVEEYCWTDSEEEEESKQSSSHKGSHFLGFVDGDNSSENEDNTESVQAHTYDRTFVVSGPVVKVYKQAQDDQKLQFDMSLPILKNEN